LFFYFGTTKEIDFVCKKFCNPIPFLSESWIWTIFNQPEEIYSFRKLLRLKAYFLSSIIRHLGLIQQILISSISRVLSRKSQAYLTESTFCTVCTFPYTRISDSITSLKRGKKLMNLFCFVVNGIVWVNNSVNLMYQESYRFIRLFLKKALW
jgi:hypothetical protein